MKLLIVMLITMLGVPALAQVGVGAKYGTRDPFTCKTKKEPARGAPSARQAADYIKCDAEEEGESHQHLYLDDNVQVEVGGGRHYQASEQGLTDIDPTQVVYPIRGTMDRYSCNPIDPRYKGYRAGANCMVWQYKRPSGVCHKTTFGDWRCQWQVEVPPPPPVRNEAPGPK